MKRVLMAHACLLAGLALTLGGELSAGRSLTAEAAAATDRAAGTPMEIALQVDGKPLKLRGRGECTFTDAGSIYEQPARGWTANFSDDAHHVSFATWRLKKDQSELLNLLVRTGSVSHRVSTVKVGDKGQIQGSGRSTFAKAGMAGGTFTIEATSDRGATITGSVTCASFVPPEDNG